MGEKAARKLRRDTGLPRTASRRSGRACGRGCVLPWAPAVRVAATRVSGCVPPDVDVIAEAEKLRGGTRVLGGLLPRSVPVPCAGTATPRRARHNLIPVYGSLRGAVSLLITELVAFGLGTPWARLVWKWHGCVFWHIPVLLWDPGERGVPAASLPGLDDPHRLACGSPGCGRQNWLSQADNCRVSPSLISANSCCAQCTRGRSWHSS